MKLANTSASSTDTTRLPGSSPGRRTNKTKGKTKIGIPKKSVGIPGYEEYQCDTNGIVYGKNGKPLKPNINSHGYKYVVFCVNRKLKTMTVHRIIAYTFVPNPNNLPVINHLDGNKLNNNVNNLEWTTIQGNTIHARDALGCFLGEKNYSAKRTLGYDKRTGKLLYDFPSLADAARYFTKTGYNYVYVQNCIWRVIKGKRKTYKGCFWKYAE